MSHEWFTGSRLELRQNELVGIGRWWMGMSGHDTFEKVMHIALPIPHPSHIESESSQIVVYNARFQDVRRRYDLTSARKD